jgi:hypothetical protein
MSDPGMSGGSMSRKGVSFLDGKSAATDLFLPVLKSQVNCQAACDRVVKLRVYQTSPGNQTA